MAEFYYLKRRKLHPAAKNSKNFCRTPFPDCLYNIGSGLFITYAIGKLANGFLADRSNIRRFLSAGLLVSALINLILGFTASFVVFLILWSLNGWVQSMGAAPCVVGLSRWFGDKERGTFYGLWSSSHNIGEAITFIVTAMIVSAWGWQWGFRGAATYDFSGVAWFWIGAAVLSVLCALTVWKAKSK